MWLSASITIPEYPGVSAHLSSHSTTWGRVILVIPIWPGRVSKRLYSVCIPVKVDRLHPDKSNVRWGPNASFISPLALKFFLLFFMLVDVEQLSPLFSTFPYWYETSF